MNRKDKKVCKTLSYIENFLISASTISGFISIFDFTSMIGIPIGITSSTIGLKICAMYKSIIKNI